jgi:hypothetical protein
MIIANSHANLDVMSRFHSSGLIHVIARARGLAEGVLRVTAWTTAPSATVNEDAANFRPRLTR